jgi:hypothetical protein
MKRIVRIDDFPHGDLAMFLRSDKTSYRGKVQLALEVFERNEVPYILGASPLLFQPGDVEFLNSIVRKGRVVLHGFNHGWHLPWENITSFWKHGGEFCNLSIENITVIYAESMKIMENVKAFSEKDFIAPFNCYTQELLDFLKDTPVERVHTSDEFWESYGLDKMEYHSMTPVVSKFKITYDDADKVIENLEDPSQITLHWCYDAQRSSWLDDYQRLCDKINEENKYV